MTDRDHVHVPHHHHGHWFFWALLLRALCKFGVFSLLWGFLVGSVLTFLTAMVFDPVIACVMGTAIFACVIFRWASH